jgi:hypothetical protein
MKSFGAVSKMTLKNMTNPERCSTLYHTDGLTLPKATCYRSSITIVRYNRASNRACWALAALHGDVENTAFEQFDVNEYLSRTNFDRKQSVEISNFWFPSEGV